MMNDDEEFMLIGVQSNTDTFEILYSGDRDTAYMEFDIAMVDEETKMNYDFLAVVKKLRTAELQYDIKEYPEESEEVASNVSEAALDSLRAATGPRC